MSDEKVVRRESLSWIPNLFHPYSLFVFFFFSYLASYLGRSKRAWPGGIIGAVWRHCGLSYSWTYHCVDCCNHARMHGVSFDVIVSRNYAERKKKGLPTDFWLWRWILGWGFGGGGGGWRFGGFGVVLQEEEEQVGVVSCVLK